MAYIRAEAPLSPSFATARRGNGEPETWQSPFRPLALSPFRSIHGQGCNMKRFVVGLILVLILAAARGLGLERTQLLAWYYAHRLAGASAADRTAWVERLITLDQAAVPSLFRWLSKDNPSA